MNFLDERIIILLCMYSNEKVNMKEEISYGEIYDICARVYYYRDISILSFDKEILFGWAEYYNATVANDIINYKNIKYLSYLFTSINFDKKLIDAFVKATKDVSINKKLTLK